MGQLVGCFIVVAVEDGKPYTSNQPINMPSNGAFPHLFQPPRIVVRKKRVHHLELLYNINQIKEKFPSNSIQEGYQGVESVRYYHSVPWREVQGIMAK